MQAFTHKSETHVSNDFRESSKLFSQDYKQGTILNLNGQKHAYIQFCRGWYFAKKPKNAQGGAISTLANIPEFRKLNGFTP